MNLSRWRMVEMPECEICGEQVNKVHRCKNCDALFCAECGSISDKLCTDCLEEDEDEEDFEN